MGWAIPTDLCAVGTGMTGDWTLIPPMMAKSVTADAVPELRGNPPIYDSLRKREERVEQTRRLFAL
jgi:H+/Cl- antiporter ClcA